MDNNFTGTPQTPENTTPNSNNTFSQNEVPTQNQATPQSQSPAQTDTPYYYNYTPSQTYNYNQPQTYSTESQQKVYIAPQQTYTKPKKQKTPRARLGIGSVALAVVICMIFSFGAAFGGTYLASTMLSENGTPIVSPPKDTTSSPSIIVQSFENPNKNPGTYDQVAEAVSPTVVEITTESIVTDSYIWGGNYVTSGAGSGVIISSDGMIVTNNHVVSGANTITVKTEDGTSYTAKVIGADADTDIAVIKIDATDLPCALIGHSDELSVGEEVIAVGNPLGNFGGTVTNGIVSALSREVIIDGISMTLIQTNAEVNPGNSGGGLFNMYGELIGIVNAKSTTSSSGISVEGIGFAIPIDSATNVVSELVNYGYVRGRVTLGIDHVDIRDSWDAMRYRVNALGVYVIDSIHEGFEVGDRIVAIDGTEITYSNEINAAIKDRKVGDEVAVKVVRAGKYVDITITLTEYVPENITEGKGTDEKTFENNFGR